MAHRGASLERRENTLASFERAIELGAPWLELDVRQTQDGELVVFHDPSIQGSLIGRLNLRELDQLAKNRGFIVPTLAQALKLAQGRAKIQIELKDQGYETAAVKTALKLLKPEDFSVISFHWPTLNTIKLAYPEVSTGLILGSRGVNISWTLKFLFLRLSRLSAINFFSISLSLWKLGFTKLLPKNRPVGVWTVDDELLIKRLLADPRVNYIVTNNPALALSLIYK